MCALSTSAQLNTDRLTAIGRNALYFEDFVLSIQYFNQVIRLKPYLAEPYMLRAIAKVQLEDWEGALEDCNQAIEINPFVPNTYYTRGFIYRQLEQWELAEQDFDKALKGAPRNRTYTALRADARLHMENYDGALEDLNRLIDENPESADLLHDKAYALLQKKDTAQAIEYFKQVADKMPNEPNNWSVLGTLCLMRNDEEHALEYLTNAIEHGSQWAGDYINRGIVSYKQHDYKTALNDYNKAVKIAPNDVQCHYNRALLLQEVGDYNHALTEYDKAIALSPQSHELYYNRGLIRMQLMQWNKALQDLDLTIKHYPYFMPAYYLAAQAKMQLGDYQGAQKYRDRAYQLDRNKTTTRIYPKPRTDVDIVKEKPQERDRRKEFSVTQAQHSEEVQDNKYESASRGSVQKHYTDVQLEPNITIGYYAAGKELRQTNYTHALLDEVNRRHILQAPLRFSTKQVTLTPEILQQHFERIAQLDAPHFFARALEENIVRDDASAIEDCTRAIQHMAADSILTPFVYLMRADLRAAQNMELDITLHDYDEVIRLAPTLSIAYYNKANLLYKHQDYKGAILLYTKAIEIDPDFAEAYFNRGLTHIYIDQVKEGLQDLSRAGERGIYQAYHLITRFR